MDSYDPLEAPNPDDWKAMDEGERILLVEDFHRVSKIRLPNRKVHAVFHVIVESQIAEGSALPVKATLERLMSEGLDRHEAVHAIGLVLSGIMYDIMNDHDNNTEADPNPAYFRELGELKAEQWRKSCEQA